MFYQIYYIRVEINQKSQKKIVSIRSYYDLDKRSYLS